MSNRKNYRGSQGKIVWENSNFRKGVNHTDEPLREGTARSLVNFDVSKTGGTLEVRDPFYSPAFKLPDQDFPQGLSKDSTLFKPIQDTSKHFILSIGSERTEIGYKKLTYSNVVKGPPSKLIEDNDIRVIDGDTIAHLDLRYRLLGIDAIELDEPGIDYATDDATKRLHELIDKADEVYVVYDKRSPSSIDVYDRHLVWVFTKEGTEYRNINMVLYDELRGDNKVKLMGGFDDDTHYYFPKYKGIEGTNFEFDFEGCVNSNQDETAGITWYEDVPKTINAYSKEQRTRLDGYHEEGKVKIPVVPLHSNEVQLNLSQVYEDLEIPRNVPIDISLNNKTSQDGEYRTEYKPWTRLDDLDALVFLGTIKKEGKEIYRGMISVQYYIPLEDNKPMFNNASFVVKTYKNNVFKVRFEELNNRYNLNLLDPEVPGRRDFLREEAEENRYYTYLLPSIGLLNERNQFVTQAAQGRTYTIRPYYVLPEIDDNQGFDGYAIKWDFYTNDNYLRNKSMMTFPDFEDFPDKGNNNVIYVDTSDSNQHYRWDGNDYVPQETPNPVVSTGWQINFDKQGNKIETFNDYYENETYRKLTPETEGDYTNYYLVNDGDSYLSETDDSTGIVCDDSNDVGETGIICYPDQSGQANYICQEVACVSDYVEETFVGFKKTYEEIEEQTYDMHELSFESQETGHNNISTIYYSGSVPYHGNSKVKLYIRTGYDYEIFRDEFTDVDLNSPNLTEISRQISIQFGPSRNGRVIVNADINSKNPVEIEVPEKYRDQSTMRVVDVAIAGEYYNENLESWGWYDLTKEESGGLYAYLHEFIDDPEPIKVTGDYRNLLSVTTDNELFQKAKRESYGNVYALVYLSRVTIEDGRHVQSDLELEVTSRIQSIMVQIRNQEELETEYEHGQDLGACESITTYKGQLVLYGSPNASNVLYLSDVGGNITYFPFRRALDQFYSDIVHVEPVKQGLIVFTSTDIYLVYEVEDDEGNIHFMANVVYSNLTIQPHNRNTVRAAGRDVVFMAKDQMLMLRPNPYVEDVTDMFLEDISTGIKELIEHPKEFVQQRLLHYKEPPTPVYEETDEPIFETRPVYEYNFNKPIYTLKKKIKLKHTIETEVIEIDKQYAAFEIELSPLRKAIFTQKVAIIDPDNVNIVAGSNTQAKLNYEAKKARVYTAKQIIQSSLSFDRNDALVLNTEESIQSSLSFDRNDAIVISAEESIQSESTYYPNHALSLYAHTVANTVIGRVTYDTNEAYLIESSSSLKSSIGYDTNEAYFIESSSSLKSSIEYQTNEQMDLYAHTIANTVTGKLYYETNESIPVYSKHNIESQLVYNSNRHIEIEVTDGLEAELNYIVNQPIEIEVTNGLEAELVYNSNQPLHIMTYQEIHSEINYDWNPPSYTVSFYDSEGLWATRTVYHGEDASLPSEPSKDGTGYVFDGWDEDLTNVTEDIYTNATWASTTHPRPTITTGNVDDPVTSIRFLVNNQNSNGHLGAELRVRHPKTLSWFTAFIEDGQKTYGETFTSLDPDTTYEIRAYNRSTVDGYNNSLTRTLSATTDPLPTYTVSFYDFDDNVISTQEITEGEDATAPSDPSTGDDCTYFSGWDRSFTNVTSNLHVLPEYEYYVREVRWVDYDGSQVGSASVNCGYYMSTSDSYWPPHPDNKSGYAPDGWDKGSFNVTQNTLITAQYKEITLTVEWASRGSNGTGYSTTPNVCNELSDEDNIGRNLKWQAIGDPSAFEPPSYYNSLPDPNNYDLGDTIYVKDDSQSLIVYQEYETVLDEYLICTVIEI